MTLRVALIGAGYWGERLLRVFSTLPDVTLQLVADIDAVALQRVAATVRTSTDGVGTCSAADVDAVVIATPPASHAELARIALRAGKHCWVEKPLALGVSDATELVDLAQRQQRTLFVDETFLYDPLVHQAREWIRGGRLGRLYHLSFQRLSMGRVRRDSDIWWNAAPHDLALLRYLTDARAVQRIRVERFAHIQPRIADVCIGTAQLEGDISVHLYLSWISPTRSAQVIAVGSRGMLRYEGRFEQRCLQFYDYAFADPADFHHNVIALERFAAAETLNGGSEEPLHLAAQAFVDAVYTGTASRSDGTESLKTIHLLDQGLCYEAG